MIINTIKCEKFKKHDSDSKNNIFKLSFEPASFRFAPGTPLYKDISEKNLIK
jgi:hypothetical protein